VSVIPFYWMIDVLIFIDSRKRSDDPAVFVDCIGGLFGWLKKNEVLAGTLMAIDHRK
jgi:hypothetical protein